MAYQRLSWGAVSLLALGLSACGGFSSQPARVSASRPHSAAPHAESSQETPKRKTKPAAEKPQSPAPQEPTESKVDCTADAAGCADPASAAAAVAPTCPEGQVLLERDCHPVPTCQAGEYLNQANLTCQPLPPSESSCQARGLVLNEERTGCRPTSFTDWCESSESSYETGKTISRVLNTLGVHNCDEVVARVAETGTLDLSHRGLTLSDLAPIGTLTSLTVLKVPNNHIVDLEPLAALKNLKVLNLHNNAVRDISPLTRLPHLEVLDLSANAIEDYRPLAKIKTLKRLVLDEAADVGQKEGAPQISRYHPRRDTDEPGSAL